ncbi:MAG: hypothetical protein KGD60_07525 [Candidatus Thorarchaeota archaeon]|nr:hypothetical protein [Candidatus Thorarchaeota archaeon]
MPENDGYTILDRPWGLRMIGVTQMAFGIFGLLATIGLLFATLTGAFATVGYLYSLVLFGGVAVPCLFIGNYVDDLRRWAVIAQIIYSAIAVGLSGYLLYVNGLSYNWTIPLFDFSIELAIGNVAAFIAITQTLIMFYLLIRWQAVAPAPGTIVERDKSRARLIEAGLMPSPLEPALLAPDGTTTLTPDEEQKIMDIRKVITEEGMAILCSNCNGATSLTKVEDNNTVPCDYCGVILGVGSVFVPCLNHEEYLAATTCNVCGEHFCRQCLTVQEPPVDEKWQGSAVYLCKKCFEGRYRPAVTTASLVIPIDQLFSIAGGRFSKVGQMYSSFLSAYANGMKHLWRIPLQLLKSVGKSGGGGNDNAAGVLVMIVIIIIAIPILAGILMILGAIIIIPILFYAGLIAVTVEAAKIISGTDFESVDNARVKSIHAHRKPKVKESKLRPSVRVWDDEFRQASLEHQRIKLRHDEERRQREERRRKQQQAASFWRTEND